MAATAAVALVELRTVGAETVQGVFRGVGVAVEKVGRQGGTALRTVAQATASVADAGRLSGGSMATMLGQLGDLAFGFGKAGPLVGAVLVAGGVITKMFLDARHEITETERKAEEELRRLRFEADSQRTASTLHENLFKLEEAERTLAAAQKDLAVVKQETALGEAGIAQRNAAIQAQEARIREAQAKVDELRARQKTLGELAYQQLRDERVREDTIRALEKAEEDRKNRTPEKLAKARATEIDQLVALGKLHRLTGDDLTRAQQLEASLTAALDKGNLSRAERVRLEQDLDKLRSSGALLGLSGPSVVGGTPTFADVQALSEPALAAQRKRLGSRIHVSVQGVVDESKGAALLLQESLRDQFAEGVSAGLTDGIAQGFGAAFRSGSIAEGFKALGAGLVSGLGGAMVQFGKASLAASTLMEKIKTGLASFLPGGAIVASLAMIALGEAMSSVGGAAQGAFGGAFGSGLGAGVIGDVIRPGQTTVIGAESAATRAAGVTPVQPVVINNPVFVSPHDPSWQTQLAETITQARGRGLV